MGAGAIVTGLLLVPKPLCPSPLLGVVSLHHFTTSLVASIDLVASQWLSSTWALLVS